VAFPADGDEARSAKRAVYRVSNTLSGWLSRAQMLAVARSLVRVGQ